MEPLSSYEARERVLVAHAPTPASLGHAGGAQQEDRSKPTPLVMIPARVLVYGWHAELDYLTVAVKVSAAFDPNAAGVTRASWTTPAAFDARCDLAPMKDACDVVVQGSARVPPRPSGYGSGVRAAELRLAEALSCRFLIDARHPGRVALEPGRVADLGGVMGLQLGPTNLGHPGRLLHPETPLEAFQCRPADYRVPLDAEIARATLTGLLEPDDPLLVVFPEACPRVLVDPAWSKEVVEAALYLDTLTLDLDRACFDFVWRSSFPGSLRGVDRLILGFGVEAPGQQQSYLERWSPVLRELSRGAFYWAHELDDVVEGRDPPPLDEPHALMARLEGWEFPVAPSPQIPLEQYAKISVELGEGRQKRELVLAKHGFDESSWAIEERAWSTQFAELPEGEDSPARRYGELIIQLQDELSGPEEEQLTVADYARLSVKLERGEPAKVLAEAGLSQGAFLRFERRIKQLVKHDEAAKRTLADEVAAARAREPYVAPGLSPLAEEALK